MRRRTLNVAILSLFLTTLPITAGAVYTDPENENLSVGIGLDVSKNGTDWYNYTADENPGGQTLVVSPGDTVTLRGQTWNSGAQNADVSYGALIENGQYFTVPVEEYGVGFGDDDGNNVGMDSSNYQSSNGTDSFDVDLNDDGGGCGNGCLNAVKDDSDPEIGSIQATIREDTPDQTVITATFYVKAAEQFLAFNPFISRAHAEGLTDATVRLLVSNPSVAAKDNTTVTTLPQTGSDTAFPLPYYVAAIALVGTFASASVLKRVVKNKAKK